MAALTVVQASSNGIDPGFVAAASGGDSVRSARGRSLLIVKNGGGSSITATIAPGPNSTRPAEGPFPSQAVASIAVSVAAGVEKVIGPIPTAYNDASGNFGVTYSAVTSVTVAAIEVPA